MTIKPRPGLVLIKKHQRTALKENIVVEDNDDDKVLMTGEILAGEIYDYKVGDTVIFGRYALYKLTIKGENFFLLDHEDILGKCNYKEV